MERCERVLYRFFWKLRGEGLRVSAPPPASLGSAGTGWMDERLGERLSRLLPVSVVEVEICGKKFNQVDF